MIESIEKLRKSSHLDDYKWTLATGEVVTVFNSKPNDPAAVNWGEQWRNMADEIEAEIAEKYMELPVDADGVPIHVGDVMEYENPNDEDKPFTILGVNNDGDVFHCLEDKRPVPTCISLANCLRHVKHDPLKELLEELANEVWEASCTCQTTWSDSGLDGIEERYAERIRELIEVDE